MSRQRSYPLKCQECSVDFHGFRPSDKFCSPSCRYLFHGKGRNKEKKQEYQKRWGEQNFQKKREYMLRYTYGITGEQYELLLKQQNYSCAICGRPETNFKRKLSVEHDHTTGEIKGLCCDHCNRIVLGKIRDPNIFRKAAEYLEKQGTGLFVPKKKPRKRKKKN
jgi:Recombination endonuclease VII